MRKTMGRNEREWISILAGTATTVTACNGTDGTSTPSTIDAGSDAGGTWQRCKESDLGIPGIRWHRTGDSLECFCPAGLACNYGMSGGLDAGPIGAPGDAGTDVGATDDTGFADAGPIDDASMDALISDDAGASP